MPDWHVDVWYDTPENKGAIWSEVASAPDSGRATEVALKHFNIDHIPGLNVTEIHIKPVTEDNVHSGG